MEDIKLKSNVYAVVMGENVMEISNTRAQARQIKNDYVRNNPSESFKIVKMVPGRFVR